MATYYEFGCPSCGYHVEVPGGMSGGFTTVSQDVLCHDCREISTCLVAEARSLPFAWDDAVRHPLRCPADASHTVDPWEHPGPCPGCGSTMERGDVTMWAD